MDEIREKGYADIRIGKHKKRARKSNIQKRNGEYFVEWYMRSDTHKPALRDRSKDRKRRAKHRAMKGRGYSGD